MRKHNGILLENREGRHLHKKKKKDLNLEVMKKAAKMSVLELKDTIQKHRISKRPYLQLQLVKVPSPKEGKTE